MHGTEKPIGGSFEKTSWYTSTNNDQTGTASSELKPLFKTHLQNATVFSTLIMIQEISIAYNLQLKAMA